MNNIFNITQKEKEYLRELAKKYMEYASLPIMDERKKLWYDHNSLKGKRPMIVMEQDTFASDIIPAPKCDTDTAKGIEYTLMSFIVTHELIDDDKVIPPYYTVYWDIKMLEFGIEKKREYGIDSQGKSLGYKEEHPILDLGRDFYKLKPSTFSVDKELTLAWKIFVEEILGDIMPVRIKNRSLQWHLTPSQKVIELMGLETMMYSVVDYPDEMHELYKFIVKDMLSFVKWQEKEGLLNLNNENDYVGSGSYGFSSELPTNNFAKTGAVTSKDLWCNMNSQETVGISPNMFGEFIYPYYADLAKEFGLVYYGCCEPVHGIWEDYISKLPGLRKVSISPWCDEEFMGEALKGSNVIYSRKPSPNFIGVGSALDEDAFTSHMERTIKAAGDCKLEIIFRDIYNLSGNLSKPGRAVKIVRNLLEKI